MAIRETLKSLFRAPAEGADHACVLLGGASDLDEAVKSRDKLMVLFYASWCPFSRAFLATLPFHRLGLFGHLLLRAPAEEQELDRRLFKGAFHWP